MGFGLTERGSPTRMFESGLLDPQGGWQGATGGRGAVDAQFNFSENVSAATSAPVSPGRMHVPPPPPVSGVGVRVYRQW